MLDVMDLLCSRKAASILSVGCVVLAYLSQVQLAKPPRRQQIVVVVPGGGLTAEGAPAPWVVARLEKAAAIYASERKLGTDVLIVTLSAATPHKPMPIDSTSKFQVYEAEGGARHLIRNLGVAAEHVFEENWSLDTIGNAFLFRAMHADVAGWRQFVVVTNDFHMPRTRLVFEKIFGLSPMPSGSDGPYHLEFVAVPDSGMLPEILESRREREAKSYETFQETSRDISSMRDMHSFLFREHMAYSSARLLRDREPVDLKALQSY